MFTAFALIKDHAKISLQKLIYCQMSPQSLKRSLEEKINILTLLDEVGDTTFKKKQAAILQRLNIKISRSSLHRLENNREKILQQPMGSRQRMKGMFKSNLVFSP